MAKARMGDIVGYKEFLESLSFAERQLSDQNMLRRALAAGGRVVRDEAKSHAPRRFGYLAGAVQVQTSRTKESGRKHVLVYVNIRKVRFVPPKKGQKRAVRYKGPLRGVGRGKYINPRAYAHLTESGSGPRYRKSGGYSGRMPARPWFFPAWRRKRAEAYRVARDYIRVEVTKVVHRLRRRSAPLRRAA